MVRYFADETRANALNHTRHHLKRDLNENRC
jgi:hypothetical protein